VRVRARVRVCVSGTGDRAVRDGKQLRGPLGAGRSGAAQRTPPSRVVERWCGRNVRAEASDLLNGERGNSEPAERKGLPLRWGVTG
jgi:hypothetical protein